jgi:stage II sporulation protein D (peptidoglycan lytic transglycosylase)
VQLPSRLQAEIVTVRRAGIALVVCWSLLTGTRTPAQVAPTDADLERASGGRTLAIGALASDRSVATVPLEVYVARVLAGEGEPGAADAAQQALAVAIRTYAIVNMGRHRREGFDLCDTTHCQVLRTASDASRRAAMATAGRVLTLDGRPVEIFYSASCGGRSESAADVWPGAAQFSYLRSVPDDVHEDEVPWVLDLSLEEIRQALARAGFGGDRLKDISIDSRTGSGRVARLRVPGLRPDAIAGDPFRKAIGARMIRSTAFSITRIGDRVRFTGVGYGHGVGMCVIGAGKRARRGETVEAILAQYYPQLVLASLDTRSASRAAAPVTGPVVAVEPARVAVRPQSDAIAVHVPRGSPVPAADLEQIAVRAHASLSKVLGTSSSVPVTIELHDSLDSFRYETGQPWWVSAAVTGTTLDLAPANLLAQREGVEMTVRTAMAELLITPVLTDRPAWVRVGAARYFAHKTLPPAPSKPPACPVDAELRMAVSATAQRDAEQRAERCFAYAVVRTGDWRLVR